MTFDGSFSAVSKADQTSTSSSTYAWNGQLTQVVKTLVGKLTPAGNFIYGPETTDEPTGAKFNDLWYKQNGNKLEMWTYERQSDGSGKWSQTLSDATGEDVKSAVAANQAEAEIAKTNSQNAVDKADSAIQQAVSAYTLGSNANQLASDAKNDAATALTNSNTALNDAKSALTVTTQNSNDITAVQADLSSAKTDLQNKITENTTAISNAQSSINTVSSDLASTKTNLQTVSDKATQNGKDINTTNSTVSGIQTDLANTQGDVTELKTTASGLETDMTNAKSDITTLKSDATGFQTAISDAQGDISTLQSRAGSLESSMSTAQGNISTLQQTATSLQSAVAGKVDNSVYQTDKTQTATSISNVVSKVDGMQIGGTNLLLDTQNLSNSWYNTAGTGGGGIDPAESAVSTKVIHLYKNSSSTDPLTSGYATTTVVHLVQGQQYTFSCQLHYYSDSPTGASSSQQVALFSQYTDKVTNGIGITITNSVTDTFKTYSVTFTAKATGDYASWRVLSYTTFVNGSLYIADQKLEVGNKPTPWSPSPGDLASQTDMSSMQQTVSGIQTNVTSAQGDISQLKQTATSLQSTVSGNSNDISTLKQTATGLTSSVSSLQTDNTTNKNSISYLQQTATSLQSSISTTNTNLSNLSSTVSTQGTEISQNSSDISLKANQTDVNTLTSRVTTAESNITANANAITQKVSANDVTSMLTPYATQTYTQSAITQKANEINSTVSQVQTNLDNLSTGGRNLLYSSWTIGSPWYASGDTAYCNDQDIVAGISQTVIKSWGDWGSYRSNQELLLEDGVDYTISLYARGYALYSSGSLYLTVYCGGDGQYGISGADIVPNTLTDKFTQYSITVKGSGKSIYNFRIEGHGDWSAVGGSIFMYGFKIEKGTRATDSSPAPEDMATNVALTEVKQTADSISTTVTNNKNDADSKFSTINQTISGIQSTVSNKADNSTVTQLSNVVQTKVSSQDYTSKVTQLSDDINLRVEKSGVIAAIDVSSEGIQIYGDKLHITASTYIDNAVIKSAMIDTLSADKITVGTLNGANVNVINLNAANITTGTLSGSNLSLNLDTGEVLFQKGAIKSTDGLLDIEINDGTFSQNNSSGDGFIFRNGNIYFSNKSSWAAWDAPLYGTISLNERAFAAGQGGMAIKGAKNVVVQTDDYNGDFVMGPPSSLTGSGLLLREDRIEMASAQTYLYGGLGYSYINHPFIEIGTSIWENQYNDNAGSNVLIRASGIILDGNVMSLNGFHIANNYITTAGDGLWVNSAFGSGGNATIHAQSFSQTSLLSKKTNVIPLDRLKARNAIRTVDIQEYMYKDDVANGITKKYSSGIIDDINEKPKYSMPFDWISADGKGREDGTALGYTIVAVQDLYDQIEDLKEQVKQLKGESAA
ncbi:hypothetical protein KBX49_11085 [Liquorilactobacillus satsumensis]|nr:hypothetical protein [Liquorilactobacillus satsumensis]MCP9372455.1 hypothetical protein [Liquorilactobacillus satsumensis]